MAYSQCQLKPIPRILTVCFGMMLVALVALPSMGSHIAADQQVDLAIRGGKYFDTTQGKFVANTGMIIKDGKLIGLNEDVKKYSVKKTIELNANQFVLPGLIDLHAHYNVRLFKKRREEFKAMPVVYLANGATVTFSAGEYDPEGMDALRKRIESGEQIGPKLLTSGPYFGRVRKGWPREGKPADEIRADVDLWAKRGVAGFKAKVINPENLKVLIDQAHKHNLTVTGHLDSGYRNSVNPRDAIEMGIDRVEHFLGGSALPATQSAYNSLVDVTPDMPEISEIVRLYVEKGVYFDATLSAYGYFGERGEEFDPWFDEKSIFTSYVLEKLKDKKRRKLDQFEKIYHAKQKIVRFYFESGGKLTLGTDHFSDGDYLPGFGVHREMDAFSRSGIPNADVIRIATINGAKAMRIDKEHGSIEKGKIADLYIVEGDPIKNIRNTRNGKYVVKAGKVYIPSELLKSVRGTLGPADETQEKDW